MRKHFLLLLFAALLTPLVSAQTNSLTAKWTPDQKVVLEALPANGQAVLLDIPPRITKQAQNLKATCEKMSDQVSTWKLSDDGSKFIITLNRNFNPQWKQNDWEIYINRLLGAYLPNE